jgi:hypothetical protein
MGISALDKRVVGMREVQTWLEIMSSGELWLLLCSKFRILLAENHNFRLLVMNIQIKHSYKNKLGYTQTLRENNVGTCSWPLTCIYNRGLENVELFLHLLSARLSLQTSPARLKLTKRYIVVPYYSTMKRVIYLTIHTFSSLTKHYNK